jgi:HPt (histidine-containing phosphotransfer) domain-containing protein
VANDNEFPAGKCKNTAIDSDMLGALEALRPPGAPDVGSKLIKIYLNSSAELIDQIRTAVRISDGPSLAKAAHSLKSASMNVGAKALGALCGELERLGRVGVSQEVGDLFHRTLEHYASVTFALEEALLHLAQ